MWRIVLYQLIDFFSCRLAKSLPLFSIKQDNFCCNQNLFLFIKPFAIYSVYDTNEYAYLDCGNTADDSFFCRH